jgi:hypothetical protein
MEERMIIKSVNDYLTKSVYSTFNPATYDFMLVLLFMFVPIVLKSESLNLLEPSEPAKACNAIACLLLFMLFLSALFNDVFSCYVCT